MKTLVIILLTLLLTLTACSTEAITPESTAPQALEVNLPILTRDFSVGITNIVPASYPRSDEQDWNNLYKSLPEYGELLGVYAEWNESQKDGIPQEIRTGAKIANQTGRTLVVGLGIKDAKDKYYFLNNGANYRKTAIQIAKEYHPKYFAVGININEYYAKNEDGFSTYTKQYASIYDAIKKENPETQVFPVFQLELMKGGRELYGEKNDPQWELIKNFENKSDMIGFTSYPLLIYPNPEDIPPTYYSEIKEHTSKPIFFSEIGWHSKEEFDGALSRLNETPFVSNEQEQADYLIAFLDQTQNLDKKGVIWNHVNDLRGELSILNFVGLNNNNGREKIISAYWKKLATLKN